MIIYLIACGAWSQEPAEITEAPEVLATPAPEPEIIIEPEADEPVTAEEAAPVVLELEEVDPTDLLQEVDIGPVIRVPINELGIPQGPRPLVRLADEIAAATSLIFSMLVFAAVGYRRVWPVLLDVRAYLAEVALSAPRSESAEVARLRAENRALAQQLSKAPKAAPAATQGPKSRPLPGLEDPEARSAAVEARGREALRRRR